MRMGDKKVENIPSISTGSLGLDLALGVMGLREEEWLKYSVPNLQEKPHLHFKL